MEKSKILDEIFSDDPLGLLVVKPTATGKAREEVRLSESFQEIDDFIKQNGREPSPNKDDILEYRLYSRLKHLRENFDTLSVKEPEAEYDISNTATQNESNSVNSIDDIFNDPLFKSFSAEESDLFDIKNIPLEYERASADLIARRKPCKDFENYEGMFKTVQAELASGKRRLYSFVEDKLKPGGFYVHNGILFYLESVDIAEKEQAFASGKRKRKDGRTRCIFENGTESNMLFRSVYKALLLNGKVVSANVDKDTDKFYETFDSVTKEDNATGFIYALKSLSNKPEIASIENLYKIGFSTTEVPERIKNAEKEPTYLMAPVKEVARWKCFNINTQKFEQLIHDFFSNSCLNVDINDEKGRRHTPREWFIVPLNVIDQAVNLISNGNIVKYRYDPVNKAIMER